MVLDSLVHAVEMTDGSAAPTEAASVSPNSAIHISPTQMCNGHDFPSAVAPHINHAILGSM